MRACILLASSSEQSISDIGTVYVRIFLPCITKQAVAFGKQLLKDNILVNPLEEGLKTYLLLVASHSDERLKYQTMSILVSLYLEVAGGFKTPLETNACAQIYSFIGKAFVQIASQYQVIFKSIANGLGDDQRGVLEACLKYVMSNETLGQSLGLENEKPKIQLKFFGA